METADIVRQATTMVRNIHPYEEVTLLSSETKDGVMFLRFKKRFCIDGIEVAQEFAASFTTLGKFIYLVTKSQAQVEAVPAGVIDNLTALLLTIKTGIQPAPAPQPVPSATEDAVLKEVEHHE